MNYHELSAEEEDNVEENDILTPPKSEKGDPTPRDSIFKKRDKPKVDKFCKDIPWKSKPKKKIFLDKVGMGKAIVHPWEIKEEREVDI